MYSGEIEQMMRTRPLLASLLLSVSLCYPAFAGVRKESPLDDLAWAATDVALVTTADTEGTFEVSESWKGDLNAGEQVIVPGLRPDLDAIPISGYPKEFKEAFRADVSRLIPRQPVGARLILFLKCSTGTGEHARSSDCRWEPLDPTIEIKDSAVWIDGGRLFRFVQLSHPGSQFLYEVRDETLETLRRRVAEVKNIQENITAATTIGDGTERAEYLKPYVRSDVYLARYAAMDELAKCGAVAVPTIRRMLDDTAFVNERPDLIRTLIRAGGDSVGEDLTRHLQSELAFWTATGPTLAKGWYLQDSIPHPPLLRHYAETLELIRGIEETHYFPALNTVVRVRDFWRSLAQRDGTTGLPDYCDKVIVNLQADSRQHP